MQPFNCMYGVAHSNVIVAVRNKLGRTVGWLCALHLQNHEKSLLCDGYHFRTLDELRARGEINGEENQGKQGRQGVAAPPAQEQRVPGDDYSRVDTQTTELAPEQSAGNRASQGPHDSETTRRAESARGGSANSQVPQTQEVLETGTPGGLAETRGVRDGVTAGGGGGSLDWPAWTAGAGYLTLTDEQREILTSPFRDAEITIRYDGIVYAPWRRYWSRIVRAFHPYVPSVIPADSPRFQGAEILVGVVMVCEGKFLGKAWGSHRLEGANDRMTVGDRIESAISDAISKIGKRLDMGEQLWDDQYRDYWKANYAEPYTSRGRTYWRRKALLEPETDDDQLPDFDGKG